MTRSMQIMQETEHWSAHNYKPLPVVLEKGEGVWVYDVDGKKYLDFLAAYSALNQGHRHPAILKAMHEQAEKITLTSRAFYNDQLGSFCKELADLCSKEMVLPMNTGAEAVETAIKIARKWAYRTKGVSHGDAEIIVCDGNFHGRTLTIVSMSSEQFYREDFAPHTPGFVNIPYGDISALENAITENTAAFIVEPIQGEAGVVVPSEGYLKKAAELCKRNNVLFMADEIQTGFGRTGELFACDHEQAKPDVYILGKAISGGYYPVSAVVSDSDVLGLFRPGEHGSTFGGNPLGAAIGRAAIKVVQEEKLAERSKELGAYFMEKLYTIQSKHIHEIRGKGLFIGVELNEAAGGARRFCEALQERGLLCKETHDNVIRFAAPLVITKEDLDWAFEHIKEVLESL